MPDIPWSVWTGKDGTSMPMRHSQQEFLREAKPREKQSVRIIWLQGKRSRCTTSDFESHVAVDTWQQVTRETFKLMRQHT